MSNACKDIEAGLAAYLDEELHNAELREFQTHLADCKLCQESVHHAERQHRALRVHLRNAPGATDLFRKRLSLALDGEERAQGAVRKRQWMTMALPVTASMVAVLALVVFIYNDLRSPSDTVESSSQVTREVARQHLGDAPMFVSSDVLAAERGAAEYFEAPVRAPRFAGNGIELLGWTPAQLGNVESARFVYEVRQPTGRHRVHAHTVPMKTVDIRGQAALRIPGGKVWIDEAYGFNTVTIATSPEIAYVFSSDMSSGALLELITQSDIVQRVESNTSR